MYRAPQTVVIPKMLEECKECGCACTTCLNNNSLDLHHEIENVRAQLVNRNSLIGQLESEFAESKDYAEQEISNLRDELAKLRDRYDRLFDSQRKLQKLNHNLEDKLLTLVNKFEGERVALQRDISNTNSKLLDAKVTICELEEECERYRSDCNIAVQMLHCKPSNFVAHKLDTLPVDLQQRVKTHLTRQQLLELEQNGGSSDEGQNQRMIRVPMPTFPPTAMMYTVNKAPPVEETRPDTVPTAVIAKVLTQPSPQRKPRRIYICDQCKGDHMFEDKEVQTTMVVGGQEVNGYQKPSPPAAGATSSKTSYSSSFVPHPGVHRPRTGSTETDIF